MNKTSYTQSLDHETGQKSRVALFVSALLLSASIFLSGSAQTQEVDFGYVLTFERFSPVQVNQVMVYATRFSEYRQYEILSQGSLDTQIHYMSDIESKLLSHNFQQSFKDIKWDVATQQNGNQFHFTFLRPTPIPVPFGIW